MPFVNPIGNASTSIDRPPGGSSCRSSGSSLGGYGGDDDEVQVKLGLLLQLCSAARGRWVWNGAAGRVVSFMEVYARGDGWWVIDGSEDLMAFRGRWRHGRRHVRTRRFLDDDTHAWPQSHG